MDARSGEEGVDEGCGADSGRGPAPRDVAELGREPRLEERLGRLGVEHELEHALVPRWVVVRVAWVERVRERVGEGRERLLGGVRREELAIDARLVR